MQDPDGSNLWGPVSLKLVRALNRDPRITDASRRVMSVYLARARSHDDAHPRQAWPSIDSVVDDTGLNRWTVQDATKALVIYGYLIEVDGEHYPAALARKTKTYSINDNPPPIPDGQAFRKTRRKPKRDAQGRPMRKGDIRPATDGVEAHETVREGSRGLATDLRSVSPSVEQRTLASVAERTPPSVAQRTHPPSLDGPNREEEQRRATKNPNKCTISRAEDGARLPLSRFAAESGFEELMAIYPHPEDPAGIRERAFGLWMMVLKRIEQAKFKRDGVTMLLDDARNVAAKLRPLSRPDDCIKWLYGWDDSARRR